MNGETFFNWIKNIIPLLKKNAVVVMDNASYHSVKIESCPTTNWRKADIEKWLYEKGETYEKPMVIPRLLEIVKRIKPRYDKYVIDEFYNSPRPPESKRPASSQHRRLQHRSRSRD
uniref:Tc1-like transposase DDE domain-containing protein n=2 Tax=Sipha flava TaxID=143950 RepID=A0A2S2PWU6_9HEMI